MIDAATKVMNRIENFRYKIRGEQVVLLDYLIPSFTDLRTNSELFHIVTLDFKGTMKEFSDKAKKVSNTQQDTMIQFSCFPGLSFTNLGNESSLNRDDSIPKVTSFIIAILCPSQPSSC